MLSKLKVAARIYLINIITALGMIGIVMMGAHYVETNIHKERNGQIQVVVETAYNLV